LSFSSFSQKNSGFPRITGEIPWPYPEKLTVVLPEHLWLDIEQEADVDHCNDIGMAMQEMYDQSRLYRVMAKIKPSPAMRMRARTLKKAGKS
jgi:hypothetical protein